MYTQPGRPLSSLAFSTFLSHSTLAEHRHSTFPPPPPVPRDRSKALTLSFRISSSCPFFEKKIVGAAAEVELECGSKLYLVVAVGRKKKRKRLTLTLSRTESEAINSTHAHRRQKTATPPPHLETLSSHRPQILRILREVTPLI